MLLNKDSPRYTFYLLAFVLAYLDYYGFLLGINPPDNGDIVFILFASGTAIYYSDD